MTTIVIPGKPAAKARPRAAVVAGRARVYTPGTTVAAEGTIRYFAAQAFPAPLTGPVRVDIIAVFDVPRSWPKARRAAALAGGWHTSKPDRDNIEKSVLDGLNGVAFADDAQVCAGETRKVYGPRAETRITVAALA